MPAKRPAKDQLSGAKDAPPLKRPKRGRGAPDKTKKSRSSEQPAATTSIRKGGNDVTKIGVAKTGDELIAEAKAFSDTVKALKAHGVTGDIQFLFKYRKNPPSSLVKQKEVRGEVTAKKEERKPAGKMTDEEKDAEQKKLDDELDNYHRENSTVAPARAKIAKNARETGHRDAGSKKEAPQEKDQEKAKPKAATAESEDESKAKNDSVPKKTEQSLPQSNQLPDPDARLYDELVLPWDD